MSTDETEQSESGVATPDPEDVPTFEGQVVFKGDYEAENKKNDNRENE